MLEQELLRNGFGPASRGIAKTLYDAFTQAVRTTSNTDIADLPWRLVRSVAISLNNKSRAPKAAAALINGLIQFFGANRPSAEVIALLEGDRLACTKTVILAVLEKSLSARQLNSATSLIDQLLALEKDPDELSALQKARAVIADRRRSKNIKVGFGIAAAAVILLIVISNQVNRPTYRSSSAQTTVDRPTLLTVDEDRPSIGTANFTRANIRYCEFQRVRLEALRSLVSSDNGSTFNGLIEDWNSRCSRYRYRPSDKSAVDLEIITRRSALQAEGWAKAYTLR